jgi:hypothetical protein
LEHDFVICRDLLERQAEIRSLFPREAGERIIRKAEEFRRCVEK